MDLRLAIGNWMGNPSDTTSNAASAGSLPIAFETLTPGRSHGLTAPITESTEVGQSP